MTICKRLGIQFAEAVTGFEFGNKRAVPVITGVVVAAENEDLVIDEWEKDEEERKRKEDAKREKAALATWRKFLMGLRILERVRDEYGGDGNAHLREEMNPFTNPNKARKAQKEREEEAAHSADNGEDMAGGFLVDDGDGAGVVGGGFLPDDEERSERDALGEGDGSLPNGHDGHDPASDGEFIIEDQDTIPKIPLGAFRLPSEHLDPASATRDGVSDSMDIDSRTPPPVKKRGRPKGASSHTPKTPKATPASKHSKPTPKPANGTSAKRHAEVSEIIDDDHDDDKPAPTKRKGRPKGSKNTSSAASKATSTPQQVNGGESGAKDTVKSHPTRTTSTRKAARNSASAVRSHYFDHSSSEEGGVGGAVTRKTRFWDMVVVVGLDRKARCVISLLYILVFRNIWIYYASCCSHTVRRC